MTREANARLMARKIPPFAALRAFEALARRGSLQAAGEELGISASAISHQLKSLEAHLGAKLLIRTDHRLQIADAGMTLYHDLQDILDRLEVAAMRVSVERETARISINLFSSLAALWMVPLLGQFNAKHPDIVVSLVTQPETIDLSGSDIDLAIQYRPHPPGGYESIELITETIAPLCSPGYLQKNGPIREPADLLAHTLISCTCGPEEWQLWMERHGSSVSGVRHWLEVDNRAAALQAGQEGIGVVMGRRPFADLALARGQLAEIFTDSVETGMSYFIVAPERSWSSRNIRIFCLWLSSVAREGNPFLAAQDRVAVTVS